MARKLFLFTKGLIIGLVLLVSSGCTEDHYYTEYIEVDPSARWEIINYTIYPSQSSNPIRWRWDSEGRYFYCTIKESKLTEFIYDEGALIGYVFFGTYDNNETQVLLPYHDNGVNIQLDYSYDLDQTIQFKFYWDDYSSFDPGLYNFKVVFIY